MTLKKEFVFDKSEMQSENEEHYESPRLRYEPRMNLDNLDYQDKPYHLDLDKIFSNKTVAINGVTEDIVDGQKVAYTS